MSDWTTPEALKAQLVKRWEKGELLAERVAAGGLFPLRLTLRGPSAGDLRDRFDAVRLWMRDLQQGAAPCLRLELRSVNNRVTGQNQVPAEVWVDTLEAAALQIEKAAELDVFDSLLRAVRQDEPLLLPWLRRYPLRALSFAGQWGQLLAVVDWARRHPRPGIYLRQIDLPGIHSKFVEAHVGVLGEWLDLVLPSGAIDSTAPAVDRFAQRYGFRDKPVRIRFRWLAAQADWVSGGDGDYTVSKVTFTRMKPAVRRVFVTENEVNFLAFPDLPESMVVFGAGYGFSALAAADWVAGCELIYWGDIDTHGFAILDQLRSHHGHVQSLLMDRSTLMAHQGQWTDEPKPAQQNLARLHPEESALYDELRWRQFEGRPIRLEQERIGFGWVEKAIAHFRPPMSIG